MKFICKSRLNSVNLLKEAEKRGVNNIHQIIRGSQMSRPTVYNYFNKNSLRYVDLSVLFAILKNGIGFTPDEMKGLLFVDVFVHVEAEDENS